jgi:hypothetical protein
MGKTRFVTRLASEALVAALTVGGALLFGGMADAAVPPTLWGILTIAPSSGIDLAVPVAHPSADCSPRVTDLHLSGGTLTKIVTRQTTNWSDPVIKADNPELAPPERTIVPVVRSDSADAKPGSQGVTELVAQDSSAGASLPINLVDLICRHRIPWPLPSTLPSRRKPRRPRSLRFETGSSRVTR